MKITHRLGNDVEFVGDHDDPLQGHSNLSEFLCQEGRIGIDRLARQYFVANDDDTRIQFMHSYTINRFSARWQYEGKD